MPAAQNRAIGIQVARSERVSDYEIAMADRDVTIAEVFTALAFRSLGPQ